MSELLTINVVDGGEYFRQVLNAMALFFKVDGFGALVRIGSLVGIIAATVGYIKTRNPMAFGHWFLAYLLMTHVVLLPKTDVNIHDLTADQDYKVDNIPVVFALGASLMTTIGAGLAETFDSLFSMPDDLQYTQTGMLFGSKLVLAAHEFKVLDPELKASLDEYFKNCVVGDIRMNHKYSVSDLKSSTNLMELISSQASPLRRINIGGKTMTCKEAMQANNENSLRVRLNKEIKKAYSFFGVDLFGRKKPNQYEELFNTHLTSAFQYYQYLTDESSNIFLQSMMMNAMRDAAGQYEALTDSTAGIVNHQFSRAQLQQRWNWQIAGHMAAWYLPLLHTVLVLMLFSLFPLVLVLSTIPACRNILMGYIQFFFSLQLWPVCFAVLNLVFTGGGKMHAGMSQNLMSLDAMETFHGDLAGVAGYVMMLIPYLANGLVSRLGEAFNGLATNMLSTSQGSSMSMAAEAANGNFGLGQTSFYNTTANNFSANKHDSNWTHMHGMHSEQMGSGVVKTLNARGEAIFDATTGMSRGVISISGDRALSGALNQSYEKAQQTALNEGHNYQHALTQAASRLIQLNQSTGHDLSLGEGVSSQDNSQLNKSLSTLDSIVSDVSKRLNINQEQAAQRLLSGSASVGTEHNWFGLKWGGTLKKEHSSTASDKFSESYDSGITTKEAKDFNQALQQVTQFTQNHHFDEKSSESASLLNQLGADLREARTSAHHYDASMSQSERLNQARSYVESHAEQIRTNYDQVFPAFVASQVGTQARDELFANPGSPSHIETLQTLSNQFIEQKKEALIDEFDKAGAATHMNQSFQHNAARIQSHAAHLGGEFEKTSRVIQQGAIENQVIFNKQEANALKNQVHGEISHNQEAVRKAQKNVKAERDNRINQTDTAISNGEFNANRGLLFGRTNLKDKP